MEKPKQRHLLKGNIMENLYGKSKTYTNFPEASVMRNISLVGSRKCKQESFTDYLRRVEQWIYYAAAHGFRRLSDTSKTGEGSYLLDIPEKYYKDIICRLRELGYRVINKEKFEWYGGIYYTIDIAW